MQKLDALTGLRFFAALGIAILHARGAMGVPSEFHELVFPTLIQGVSFFFVLSGFILTYNYSCLEDSAARRRFLWARFARLWPAHLFALLLVVALGVPHWGGPLTAVLNVALLHAWIPVKEVFFSYNSVSWSVSTEFAFYLLFPLLIINLRKTWIIKLLLSVMICFLMLAICWIFQLAPHPDYRVGSWGLYYASPLGRLFEFVTGMVAALLWSRHRHRIYCGILASTFIEIAAIMILIGKGLYYTYFSPAFGIEYSGVVSPIWLTVLWYTPVASALVIIVFASRQGLLSQLLSTKTMIFLGEISYSLYLVHLPLRSFFAMHEDTLMSLFGRGILFVYALTVLAVATASWRLIEKPARLFLVSLLPPQRSSLTVESRPLTGKP